MVDRSRWQRLDDLYHAASERAPEERAEFLANACSDDADLQCEVESLLAQGSNTFLRDPGWAGVCEPGDALPSAAEAVLSLGASLGAYRVTSLIASGGMGQVYRAHDERLGRDVAIKVLFPGQDARRFAQEARTVAALIHPRIVAIFDVGSQGGIHWLVLELVYGEPLRELLRKGPLNLVTVLKLSLQIAEGLAVAHHAGVVHRDLKPSNIMITPEGDAKILDFGLAVQRLANSDESASSELTRAGCIIGTSAYMSPEQANGRKVDARSDIFAYGAVLYEMLSGRRAFQAATPMATLAEILHREPKRLTEIAPDTPPELVKIIDHCLCKDARHRFQSIEEVRIAIERLDAEAHVGRRPTRLWLSRKAALWVSAGVVVLGLAGFGALRLAQRPSYGHAEAVIADLDNETGDTEFDHSLTRMLQIDLQQSPYFTVVGEVRARETLKMMRKPEGAQITGPVAREICQRLNGQIYLMPAIAKIGDHYLLSLQTNDCTDGHSLGAVRKEASSKGDVLSAFGSLARHVRRDAGESRASLQRFDKPLFNVPTASLEALKLYSEATRLAFSGKQAEAIPLYRRAIDLDPNFAVAYANLASMYFNIGDEAHDREAISKAYALRGTVNEYQRLFIEYSYHSSVTGDLYKERDALRQWADTYPQDNLPLGALINLETQTGQSANATAYADRALELDRRGDMHSAMLYEIAARAYLRANMPEKLRSVVADALRLKADSEGLHGVMLDFAADHDDAEGVKRQIEWSRGNPAECRMLQMAAMAALASGQVRRADQLFTEAVTAARRDNLQDSLVDFDDYRARMLVELGLTNEAKALLKTLPTSDTALDKAFTQAEVGDASQALAEAQRRQNAAPTDTLLNADFIPSVRAAVALRQGKPGAALELLQAALSFELRDPTVPYLRGQAFLAARKPREALAEFAKLADQPWRSEPLTPLITLAHLGLARAFRQQSEFAASRNQYETLFRIWKGAEAIPILELAHNEYAKLPASN